MRFIHSAYRARRVLEIGDRWRDVDCCDDEGKNFNKKWPRMMFHFVLFFSSFSSLRAELSAGASEKRAKEDEAS